MVRLIAIIKPFRIRAVLAALEAAGFSGGTLREAMGYGRQKHALHRYLGSEYDMAYLPKVEISLFLPRDQVPDAVRAISSQARTGRMGDGKIFVLPCLPDSISW
jgi:nitrogen regulatory protein PII